MTWQEAAAAAAAAASGRLGAHVQSLGASAGPPHPLEDALRALRYPDWQLQPQAPQPPRVRALSQGLGCNHDQTPTKHLSCLSLRARAYLQPQSLHIVVSSGAAVAALLCKRHIQMLQLVCCNRGFYAPGWKGWAFHTGYLDSLT